MSLLVINNFYFKVISATKRGKNVPLPNFRTFLNAKIRQCWQFLARLKVDLRDEICQVDIRENKGFSKQQESYKSSGRKTFILIYFKAYVALEVELQDHLFKKKNMYVSSINIVQRIYISYDVALCTVLNLNPVNYWSVISRFNPVQLE